MFKVLGFLLFFGACSDGRVFNNPVLDGADYPDPGVILEDGVYYAVTTTNNDESEKFPIHTSTNLQDWTLIGYVFNETNFPPWSKTNYEFWAPEIHKFDDEYRVYFTSRDIEVNQLSIGVATSKNVAGPYKCLDRPLISRIDVIDSTVMRSNNTLMLAWVEYNNITIGNLSTDGLSFKDNRTVSLFGPDLPWEGPTAEGPWYMFRNGYHNLFYSGNNMCTDLYALGVARSRTAEGPYEKLKEPLLVSNDKFKGPGHGSIVKDIVNDGWAFVHHAWKDGAICGSNPRLMFTTSMEWGDDDWPKKMSIGN